MQGGQGGLPAEAEGASVRIAVSPIHGPGPGAVHDDGFVADQRKGDFEDARGKPEEPLGFVAGMTDGFARTENPPAVEPRDQRTEILRRPVSAIRSGRARRDGSRHAVANDPLAPFRAASSQSLGAGSDFGPDKRGTPFAWSGGQSA